MAAVPEITVFPALFPQGAGTCRSSRSAARVGSAGRRAGRGRSMVCGMPDEARGVPLPPPRVPR
jgi:hypothetical protein